MAQERAVIDEAYAGDIIGVFDPGIFSIGDTICEKGMDALFEGIPTFAPEHFAGVERVDTMKRKQFEKGIMQIAQEGAIQIFHEPFTGVEEELAMANSTSTASPAGTTAFAAFMPTSFQEAPSSSVLHSRTRRLRSKAAALLLRRRTTRVPCE